MGAVKCATLAVVAALSSLVLTGFDAVAQQPPGAGSSQWDLPSVYPDEAAWEADRAYVLSGLDRMASARGRAALGAESLAGVLDLLRAVRARAGKMARFAVLSAEIDQSSALARSRYVAATELEVRVEASAAPLEAEIIALGRERIRSWQAMEQRLEPHRRRLHKILAEAVHRPAPALQSALATMERWPRSLSDTADILAASDLGWLEVQIAGKKERIDAAGFARFRRSPDRAVREAANSAYFGRLRLFEGSFGSLLTRRIEADTAIASVRVFESHLDAFYVLHDGIPPGAYRHAIDLSGAGVDSMRRLARVIGRLQGTERVTYGDLQARTRPYSPALPIDRAVQIAISSVAALGPQYQQVMRERLAQPWYHIAPAANKSETLGVFWQVGGGHPYGLMNYRDDLGSSRTFAQVAGGTMMYADIPSESFPDRREEDPQIHGNAHWYASGYLHDDYLLQQTTDRDDRIALLVQHLQSLVRLAVQDAVLLELEEHVAREARAGRPMTGSQLSATYLELLRRRFGHGAGGFEVDDTFSTLWISDIPAIFSGPYPAVFNAAGAAGALIVEKVRAGNRDTIASMRHALGRGDSDYSYDLLLAQGVDMNSRAPYEALFRRIERATQELDATLTAR